MEGDNLLKYCRKGKPVPRHIFLREDSQAICCKSLQDKNTPR